MVTWTLCPQIEQVKCATFKSGIIGDDRTIMPLTLTRESMETLNNESQSHFHCLPCDATNKDAANGPPNDNPGHDDNSDDNNSDNNPEDPDGDTGGNLDNCAVDVDDPGLPDANSPEMKRRERVMHKHKPPKDSPLMHV